MRVLVAAAATLATLSAGQATFEVLGTIAPEPLNGAMVMLHATGTPFAVSARVDPGGRYRFKRVPAGSYTLAAVIVGKGQIHRTLNVGPAVADPKRRIYADVDTDRAVIHPDRGAIVSAGELAVPKEARREYARASHALARRDTARAVHHLERAVDIAPGYSGAWNNLGTIAYQTGKYSEAERYFRRARVADPETFEPLVNLGGVLLSLNRYHEARLVNLQAVARKPKDALAQAQLGLSYLKLMRMDLAEVHLGKAVELDPKHFTNPQVFLAEIYLRRNKKWKAAEHLADFLKHRPDWPERAEVQETIKRWSREGEGSRPDASWR